MAKKEYLILVDFALGAGWLSTANVKFANNPLTEAYLQLHPSV